jgi:peptidoglycan/LPS O-acetylase OafA/YrhL
MVLAVVSGTGSFSRGLGWRGWRPIATGSYTLYLTHMLAIPVAQVVAESLSGGGTSLTGRWLAFLPWYLAGICLRSIRVAQTRRKAGTQLAG